LGVLKRIGSIWIIYYDQITTVNLK
jgi:hypothetical protein